MPWHCVLEMALRIATCNSYDTNFVGLLINSNEPKSAMILGTRCDLWHYIAALCYELAYCIGTAISNLFKSYTSLYHSKLCAQYPPTPAWAKQPLHRSSTETCRAPSGKIRPVNMTAMISRIAMHAGEREELAITTIGGSHSKRYASFSCHFMNWYMIRSIGDTLMTDMKRRYTESSFSNQTIVFFALTLRTFRYRSVESPDWASIISAPVTSSSPETPSDDCFPCSRRNPSRRIWWYPNAHLTFYRQSSQWNACK